MELKAYHPGRKDWRLLKSGTKRFGKLYHKRRNNLKSLEKITKFIFFFWFLVISVKVGESGLYLFYNKAGLDLLTTSKGVDLPVSTQLDKSIFSSHHYLTIVIHKDDSIRISGLDIELIDVKLYIKRLVAHDPLHIVLLVVDQKCKMNTVNKILKICKENGAFRIRFMTSLFTKKVK